MNCKPGDLAVVIMDPACGTPMAGRVVEVIHTAPQKDFRLPDGNEHLAAEPNRWVCKSLGSPFSAPIPITGVRIDRAYGVIPDFALRPLADGEPVETETEREVTV